jgi:uncharacterized protein
VATAATAAAAGLRNGRGDPSTPGAPARLRLATGPPGGVYREVGGELLKVLAERFPGTEVTEIRTDGSVDNLDLLSTDSAELAFAHLDSTVAGLAAGRPPDITAVARLSDSWMHVMVLSLSPVKAFTDLDRQPITAGAAGSGSLFISRRLVERAGIRPVFVDALQDQGADLLADGKVAAMLTLTGMPTPAVSRLAKRVDVRMIPLDGLTEPMASHYGDLYTPATLPDSVYPRVSATETMTVPNLLLARPELPASVVEVVSAALFAERERIARGHPDANHINVRTAIATAPVRLHPGAIRYFRAMKR